ncbi:heme exporter protein CcmD [Segnochrobactrum spirostomi]|uniref:Heme exporter protein D n=1 Tax=Segnochrobactrum spirostomi TaxID=2608987 RepID=A0A6A7Y0N7_9HYPH|nr:heme exporter protein CcmD [Segnochrobactrum spirostomi]MQT12504.1 heme exporter protein CcmD [Segnochrobactrum spirostomi]
MFGLGPHAGFIVAAYAAVAVTLVVTIGKIVLDYRALGRRIRTLEARGVKRRSEGGR